jgi:hypothetical protein
MGKQGTNDFLLSMMIFMAIGCSSERGGPCLWKLTSMAAKKIWSNINGSRIGEMRSERLNALSVLWS